MISSIHRFATALRRGGLAVTAVDVTTAAEAALAIDLDDRASLRSALQTTLIRHRRDLALFNTLFDAMFSPTHDDSGAFVLALSQAIGASAAASVLSELSELSAITSALVGASPGDVDSILAAGGGQVEVGGAQTILSSGAVAYRVAVDIGLENAEAELIARLQASVDPARAEHVAELVRQRVASVRAALRERVTDRLKAASPNQRQALALSGLEERSFAGLTPAEMRLLHKQVGRLARGLLAARRRRRPRHCRGRLDISRTLRSSVSADGVPVVPMFVRARRRRPRIVVLCDVSDSVRNVSQFMLALVHSIARLTDGVRSFAFVAELGEITGLFRRAPIDRAIAQVSGGAVINVLANSNYGRAFGQFVDRHLGVVTSRSTVIVIGDGRTNYHDPGLQPLAQIRRRAGRLLWLNPEPEAIWGFGDSAMNEYRAVCDDVAVAGNLQSLEEIVDELV